MPTIPGLRNRDRGLVGDPNSVENLRARHQANFANAPKSYTQMQDYDPTLGRAVGVSIDGASQFGEVWTWGAIPLGNQDEAESSETIDRLANPLNQLSHELAALSNSAVSVRRLARGSYREVHLLGVRVPKRFQPHPDNPNAENLRRWFGDQVVPEQVALIGVRNISTLNAFSSVSELVDDLASRFTTGGATLSMFDKDVNRIRTIMDNVGLRIPTSHEMQLADTWWNQGQHAYAPKMAHSNHLHFFDSLEHAQIAKVSHDTGIDCSMWTPELVPGEHTISMICCDAIEFDWERDKTHTKTALWLLKMMRGGALCVSVRGSIEPARNTFTEFRSRKRKALQDAQERAKSPNALENHDLALVQQQIETLEKQYSSRDTPPTWQATSIVAGINGPVPDLAAWTASLNIPLTFAPMVDLQDQALGECGPCSPARANSYRKDVPAHVIAYCGVASLDRGGDDPKDGALFGFSENDHVPIYISSRAGTKLDAPPVTYVAGATRSGKTIGMEWLATQWAQMPNRRGERTPVGYSNMKPRDHLDTFAEVAGGRTINVSDLYGSDGILDPIRFSPDRELAVQLGVQQVLSVNPYGTMEDRERFAVPLTRALRYGVEKGGTSIGHALDLAWKDHKELYVDVNPKVFKDVFELVESEPKARCLIGRDPQGESLVTSDGLTLIQAGDAELSLPSAGALARGDQMSLPMRVDMAIIRGQIHAFSAAYSHRDGVIFCDEGWVFLIDPDELNNLSRVIASRGVKLLLMNQRTTEAEQAKVNDFMSEGIAFSMRTPGEAQSTTNIMQWKYRVGRIHARMTSQTPYESLKAVVDPVTREVHRGSVAYYADLHDNRIPVEVRIPDELLLALSTNQDDREKQQQAMDVWRAARAAQGVLIS